MTVDKINISIPAGLKQQAQELDINVSKAAAAGIKAAIDRELKIRELGL